MTNRVVLWLTLLCIQFKTVASVLHVVRFYSFLCSSSFTQEVLWSNKMYHQPVVTVCACVWVVPWGMHLGSDLTDTSCCLSVPNSS